jgi:hypothetical protein
MAEATQYGFTHKELATMMIKALNIHSGIWGIAVKFGLGAINAGSNDNDLMPAAVLPVMEIGLQKFDKVNNLSVDAAQANPAT